MLSWNDLTEIEKEQAEDSYLSIMADISVNSQEDKIFYEEIENDRDLRLGLLQEKSFVRDNDGYIFVSI